MWQVPWIQYNRGSAIVQDNDGLFMVSILHMKKSFKVCSSGPGLSGTTSKNCSCPCTEMTAATGWVQPEMATYTPAGNS